MEIVDVLRIVEVCIGAYLLGSIPFGKIVGKYIGRVDIQKVGSGNIGGTNVGRTLGFKYGALVVGLDAWKGALPVILTLYFFWQDWWLVGLAWLSAFLGHVFPVWLKFKGGKGVSVFIGGLLALLGWKTCLIIFACWIIVFLFFVRRKISAANLVVAAGLLCFILLMPILLYLVPILLVLIGFIWWAHRENLQRLSKGKEPSMKLPSIFDKIPDDLISLAIRKLQSFITKLQNYQQKKP
jgi:glycerol-3-phosphate acyltransferase PlsY